MNLDQDYLEERHHLDVDKDLYLDQDYLEERNYLEVDKD